MSQKISNQVTLNLVSNSGLKPTPPTSGKASNQIKLMGNSSTSSLTSAGQSISDSSASFTQDINAISQKIADLTGEPAAPPLPNASSTFVSGLRSLTSSTSNEDAIYKQNMEKLMSKIGELDRHVLKKTAPESVGDSNLKRRSSRGMDLHYLPTHLHIIDRLMDLYNQSKRVTVIRHGTPDTDKENGVDGRQNGSSNNNNNNNTLNNYALDNGKVKSLEAEVATLKQLVTRLQASEKKGIESAETFEVQIKAYKTQLSTLQTQLKAAQDKVNEQDAVIASASNAGKSSDLLKNEKEVVRLTSENEALKMSIEKYKLVEVANAQLTSSSTATTGNDNSDIIRQLEFANLKIKESESALRTCEMKLKAEVLLNEQMHDVIKAKIDSLVVNSKYDQLLSDNSSINMDNLRSVQQSHIINYKGYLHLKPESIKLFEALDEQLKLKLTKICDSVVMLSSIKESLESEIQTYQLERVLLNNDLTSVSNQLDSMKGAYHALETEHVNSTRQILKMSCNLEENSNAADLQKRVDDLQETVNHLQNELLRGSRRAQQYEKLPLRIAELELALSDYRSKSSNLETECGSLNIELEGYKRLTQSLKDKIKSLGSVGSAASASLTNQGGKDKEFFDSFEEVMQEEMMTMKSAFEAKLRLAREEAEMATKRHLVEIQRMQNDVTGPK